MAKNQKNCPDVARGNEKAFSGNTFSFSVGARIDPRVNGAGLCSVFLQIIVNRKRRKIPLDFRVKPSEWNKSKNRVKKNNPMADEYNMLIRQGEGHANNIAIRHRLNGKLLTADMLKHAFGHSSMRGGDFLRYMEGEIETRRGDLSEKTIQHHVCTLNKLRTCFPDGLGFNEINYDTIEEFSIFMKVRGLKINTRTGNLKRWQGYVNRAMRSGYILEDPFADFKLRYYPGDRESLTREELRLISDLYESAFINATLRDTLRCFLFSCYTGLRIGDLHHVSKRSIVNNELVFMPQKTQHISKTMRIPLSEAALHYVPHDHPQWLFTRPADQTMNDHLKTAAQICGIQKGLHYHMSRHTFATLFLESGGDVTVLQKLLGHATIDTTMVYTHISDKRKRDQINLLTR